MNLLPTEICIKILNELPCSEAGVHALARCGMTGNSTLRDASMDPSLWRVHYKRRYIHAECERECERRNRLAGDWRRIYQERRQLDREALENLRIIEASSPKTRIEHARRIASLGLDVWDALSEESRRPLPPLFQRDEDIEKVKEGSPLTNLTKKYWASELLKIIARRHAIDQWSSLKRATAGEQITPVSFEEAFATLSSFHGILPDEIMNHINSTADGCRSYLEHEEVPYTLGTKGFDITRVCFAVREYMRSQDFDIAHPSMFYEVCNSLPHVFMTSHRRTLPISLVFIFVAIMKRLGLEASPMNTPNTVTALVRNALLDFSRTAPDFILPIPNYDYIRDVFTERRQTWMTIQLLVRAARNIRVANTQQYERLSDNDPNQDDRFYTRLQAEYLSRCLLAFIGLDAIERILFPTGWRFFPLDMELVVHDKGLPYAPTHSSGCDDDDAEENTALILGEDLSVSQVGTFESLFVGQLVYAKNSVLRSVVGWKKQDEQIFCSTIAYCHHNVTSFPLTDLTPTSCSADDILTFLQNPVLGQFFEDAEFQETNIGAGRGRGRFIMNKRLRRLHPDDDIRGARWVRGETT